MSGVLWCGPAPTSRGNRRQCGVGRDRTGDTRIFSPLLYRLSYRTIFQKLTRIDLGSIPFPSERDLENLKLLRRFIFYGRLSYRTISSEGCKYSALGN